LRSPAVVSPGPEVLAPALFLNGGTELPAAQGAGISVLTHAELQDWVSQALREVGAEAVSGEGPLDAVRAVHSEIFVRAVSKRREALRAPFHLPAALRGPESPGRHRPPGAGPRRGGRRCPPRPALAH
jgi:hypothetical protein